MSFHTPTPQQVVQKTPDPLINLGEAGHAAKNERNKRGLMSTFLSNNNPAARSSGILGSIIRAGNKALGNSNV